MAYRTAGAVEADPPRVRPEATIVEPNFSFKFNLAFGAVLAASGLGLVPLMIGPRVSCARTPGDTPVCTASQPGWLIEGGFETSFAGKADAVKSVETTVSDDTEATELSAWGKHSRPVSESSAREVAEAYERFVADPNATTFERRVTASAGALVVPPLLFFAGLGLLQWARKKTRKSRALVIDPEVDELVVEDRFHASPPVALRVRRLSGIAELAVEDKDDRMDRYVVMATCGGERVEIYRALESSRAEQVRDAIKTAIDKKKKPATVEDAGDPT